MDRKRTYIAMADKGHLLGYGIQARSHDNDSTDYRCSLLLAVAIARQQSRCISQYSGLFLDNGQLDMDDR